MDLPSYFSYSNIVRGCGWFVVRGMSSDCVFLEKQMQADELKELINQLMCKLEDGPNGHLETIRGFTKYHAEIEEFGKIMAEVCESLQAVRIVVKYLMFDLEATRRERDQLRMLLGDAEESP
jgi:hypothetical protein